MTILKKLGILLIPLTFTWLALPPAASACATCYGDRRTPR